ncbi:MAG: mechanosensitive ion channel family protein [Pseudomonadales bacterium]|nr:mechanosensitive ion channel family protein [Pseudomonadales bacterium]MDG1441888.1 mechanosensitive ion channel family protein [Pseudomonadales bacterium]
MAIENPLGEELAQAEVIYQKVTSFLIDSAPQIFGAIIILVAGYVIANSVSKALVKFLIKKDLDVTLSQLLGSITYFSVLFIFVVIALGKFNISITPFVAALGAFTLGAGLAIQGIVSNYGAGFSIIFTRPFVVGNTLTVQHVSGVVVEIRLAYTLLENEDGERIMIPNKEIVGQILENSFEYKLVETIVTIEATADPTKTIDLLANALKDLDCIAQTPASQFGIDEFSPLGIKLGIRCWVPTKAYFESKYRINRVIFDTLRDNQIKLSVPRQEIQITSSQ